MHGFKLLSSTFSRSDTERRFKASIVSSVSAGGVLCVPLSSVCVVKLRKTSPHHSISQPILSSMPVSPLCNCYINLSYEHSHSMYEKPLILSLSFLTLHLSAYDSVYLQCSFSLSPLLLLLCFFLGAISDPSLSSLLPPCGCSHFLTLPRTRHTQPIDDPQRDPR